MKFILLKIVLCCHLLFALSVRADQSQTKKEEPSQVEESASPSQAQKEEPSQVEESASPSQAQKEEPSQVEKSASSSQMQEEESSSIEESFFPSQVQKEDQKEGSGQVQVLEVKEGTATIKVPAHQKLSVDQILYIDPIIYPNGTQLSKKVKKVDVVKRNGFVTLLGLWPSIKFYDDFSYEGFYLDVATNYGLVFGKLADAGIVEGAVGLSGTVAPSGWGGTVSVGTELNFIENNGVNKVIPGLSLNFSFSYSVKHYVILMNNPYSPSYDISNDGFGFHVSTGLYLKYFFSKQFAVMPTVQIGYGHFSKERLIRSGLGLEVRMYF